jgi:hypothetical protein
VRANAPTYTQTVYPTVTETPLPSATRSHRPSPRSTHTPWPSDQVEPVQFEYAGDSPDGKEKLLLLPDQGWDDRPLEFIGNGSIKKDWDEADPNEDDVLTVTYVIVSEGSNVNCRSPVEAPGKLIINGGSLSSESSIRIPDSELVSLSARKKESDGDTASGSDGVNIPHLNLGHVGNDCYDLPENLYIDASVLDEVEPVVFENDAWVQAENLTNCEEWRSKAADTLYKRARLEWVCKAIEMSAGSSNNNVTGLFLVGKKATVEAPKDSGEIASNPIDDKNSYGLIIGISVGIVGVVIGTVIGVVTYCRSKNREDRSSSEGSVESYSYEDNEVERSKSGQMPVRRNAKSPVGTSLFPNPDPSSEKPSVDAVSSGVPVTSGTGNSGINDLVAQEPVVPGSLETSGRLGNPMIYI